ncbi:MAG: disulfide bond formation protein B [Alphaproteobacteria bacterium]|jgi:disulfide bond formation protein DsbB|nr:disulfide bond formation protein B [Alphaproteobacteria bacterium]
MKTLCTLHNRLCRAAPYILVTISAAMLLTVYLMQHIGGLEPCPLCVTQRYAHFVAGGLALTAVMTRGRLRAFATILTGFALLSAVAYATYHVGVERGWFTSSCAGAITGGTIDDIRARIMEAPLTRCDEVPWALFGISLAGWNAIISLALAGFAIYSGALMLFSRLTRSAS